jgi:hypothetical protein
MDKISELKRVLPSIQNSVPNLVKESANSLCGPCFICGGVDRLFVRDGHYYCRQCGIKGDVIDYHCLVENTDINGLIAKYLPDSRSTKNTYQKSKPFVHYELGTPVAKYQYTDASGKVLYYNCRFEPKTFRQCGADGNSWKVTNIKPKVPYNLQAVIEADEVFLVEGEKDVQSLAKLSLVGSCNVAGAEHWTPDLNEHFSGKNVYLIPDNDGPGKKHVVKVYENLKDIAASIKLIELPGLPEHGDFSDWLSTYTDLDEAGERFAIILDGAGPYIPDTFIFESSGFNAAELMKMTLPEPKWAIPNILPEGLNILAGKPKMGKSVLSLNISIAIACGGKALSKIDVEKGAVLYLALEDTKRRLQARIKSMLQDRPAPDNLFIETAWPKIGDRGLAKLEKKIQEIPGLRLVIIDTLKKIKPMQKNQNKSLYDIDYELINSVKTIADKYSICILIIHHMRKSESNDVMDDFSGTFGLTGAADGLLAFKRKTGQSDAELHIVGRDVDAAEYALKYHPDIWTWELLGNAEEVKTTQSKQLIYDTIKDSGEDLTPKEIQKISGVKYWTVIKNLKLLTEDGSLSKTTYGKYRIPSYL